MTKLNIILTKGLSRRTKRVTLYFDGEEVEVVYNNETKELEIPSGTHRLSARTGWCGSEDYTFTMTEDETRTLEIDIFKYANWIVSSIFMVMALHFIAMLMWNIKFISLLNIPLILFFLYYLTLGRNKYLVIKKV